MNSSLQDELDNNGAMDWTTAAQLIAQVADAVAYAHDKDVLHRDLKPGNILIGEDGVPQVSDFGIAKLTDVNDSKSSRSLGTPAYMPPERFDAVPPTEATDIYGLAATFTALVTGTPPFTTGVGDTDAAVVRRVLAEAPPDLTNLDVPESVARLIGLSMSKDPASRPTSARDFAADLRTALAAAGVAVSAPVTIAVKRRISTSPVAAAVGGSTHRPRARVLALIAAVVFLLAAGIGVAAAQLRGRGDSAVVLSVPDPSPDDTTDPGIEAEILGASADSVAQTDGGDAGSDALDSELGGEEPSTSDTELVAQTTTTSAVVTRTDAPDPGPTATEAPEPASACFNASRAEVEPGQAVVFTNCSTDATSYEWDFGDGRTSSQTDPSHTWTTAGSYTVRLKATGATTSDSMTASVSVTAEPEPPDAPEACFRPSKTSVDIGDPVSFTNCSTNATGYGWSFDDGTTSLSSSPSHTFNSADNYTVLLTATGPGGTDTVSRIISVVEVVVPAPRACFTASPTKVNEGGSVAFTNCSTNASTYSWNFGDGSATSTSRSPSHTFTTPGSRTVSLTATGPGGTRSTSKTITVTKAPPPEPDACFTPSETTVDVGDSVTFRNCSTGATTYEWDFGDGSAKSETKSPSHTFAEKGDYTVTLVAKGGDDTDTTSEDVRVRGEGDPVACFTVPGPSVRINESMIFTDCSTGASSIEWDFGDGTTSTLARPSHTWSEEANFTVRLTATATNGKSDFMERTIEVVGEGPGGGPVVPQTVRCQFDDDTNVTWFWAIYHLVDTYILEFSDRTTKDVGKVGRYSTTDGVLRAITAKYNGQEASREVGTCEEEGGTRPPFNPPSGIRCRFHSWVSNEANNNWESWSEAWTWDVEPGVDEYVLTVNTNGANSRQSNGTSGSWDRPGHNGQSNSGVSLRSITAVKAGREATANVANCIEHGGEWVWHPNYPR